jgi:Uma2 family endonuclease
MSTITSLPRSPVAPPSRGTDSVLDNQRIVVRGVGWHVYRGLSDAVGEGQHIRLAYDGKDLELMATSPIHERYKELFGQFVNAVTLAQDIDSENVGEATWDTEESERGLQADQSYYFNAEKLRVAREAFARKSKNLADYPKPDLAIEVDASRPQIDRPSIYAALEVVEVWRFDGANVVIEHLQADGSYLPADSSRFLPVRVEDVRRWLIDEDSTRRLDWLRRLNEWAQGLRRQA